MFTKTENATPIRKSYPKIVVDDSWYKLVVKILKWEEHDSKNSTDFLTKISKEEWQIYCAKITKNSSSAPKDTIQQKIEDTKVKIEKNDGFDF